MGIGSLMGACRGVTRNDLQAPGGSVGTVSGLDEVEPLS